MTHLDLFSGIGGFALAARWMGWQTVGFAEVEPFACAVLAKHWPEVKNYGDVAAVKRITADILTAGIPCQPYSCAGKRLGDADDRALWPEARRIVAESRPSWVVVENVAGFIGMALDDVLSDLEAEGYETGTVVLPACAVNAPHRRDRVWIVANANQTGWFKQWRTRTTSQKQPTVECRHPCQFCGYEFDRARLGKYGCPNCLGEAVGDAADSNSEPPQWVAESRGQCGRGQFEPPICRIPDEFSDRLDETGLKYYIIGYSDLLEYSNAKAEITRPDQVLRDLRETTFQETLWDKFRGPDGVRQKEVLRPTLYGGRNDERPTDVGGIAKEGGGVSRSELSRMRNDRETSGSPYRHESGEQRTIEHHDVVRLLSHIMALETWQSSKVDMLEAIALHRLQQGISEIMAGHVPETLSEVQKIWRSSDNETMEWLMLRVGTGDPFCNERPNIPRIASGVPNRAARLKALGNAIVPQVAYRIFQSIQATVNDPCSRSCH